MQFYVKVKSAAVLGASLEREAYAYPAEVATRGSWTLREMLGHLVREGLAAYQKRDEQRKLIHVLTAAQITEQARTGKVAMGGREEDPPPVDEGRAVELAGDAFKQGLYLVFADGEGVLSLDKALGVREGMEITFVQLTLLIGR